MDDPVRGDADYVRGKAQWRMAIVALRRMRSLVGSFEEEEQFKKSATRTLVAALVLVLVLGAILIVLSPSTLESVFRRLS